LKVKCDEPLSNVTFNVNVRRYSKDRELQVIALSNLALAQFQTKVSGTFPSTTTEIYSHVFF
jgi:hypothetical protein